VLRRIGYIGGALVVLAVVAAVGYRIYESVPAAKSEKTVPKDVARRTTAYQLADAAWTSFPVPRPTPRVRLLVHADVPTAAVTPQRSEPVRFAVQVQGLNDAGEVVFERLHHFRAGFAFYRMPNGQTRASKAYADRAAVPSGSELTILRLPEPARVDRLRLRTATKRGAVSAVNARLYAPERLSGAQVDARWPRLSADQRARLADGNVYPPQLLTKRERARLSAVRWHRLGPSGLAGRDYVERTLYIRDTAGAEPVTPPAVPQGVRVGPQRRVTMKLPEERTAIRVQYEALDRISGQARVLAFADRPGEVRRETVPWQARRVHIERTWEGRLLEMQSDVPAVVRVAVEGDPEARGPDPAVARVFSAAAAPRWRVRHVGDSPTPFRIDLRCRCFAADGKRVAAGQASVALVNATGEVMKRVDVTVAEPVSLYDRVLGSDGDHLITEPRRLYFRLPPEVSTVRVSGSGNVHAAAFNRPNNLQRTIRVPEDRFARPQNALRDRRSWFYVPPTEKAVPADATKIMAIHTRPPRINPVIAGGNYDWQSYRPEGDWSARRVLLPRQDDAEVRPEALNATYTPLPTGEMRRLRIDAASPRPVRPSLVFVGHDVGQDASVKLTVDGKLVFERTLSAASGRLKVPALTRGRHEIRVESDSQARFYLSNVVGGTRRFDLRLANRLRTGTTRFVYEKTKSGAELLSFRLYPVLPSSKRRRVDVTIDGARVAGLTPYANLTLPRRRYDVRVDTGSGYPVLGAADTVGEARRFFLQLGAELPAGRYPVDVRLHGEREAYLTLSTTTPGRSEARDIRRMGVENEP